MLRVLFSTVTLLFSIAAYSQEFLNDDNYAYGVGVADDEHSAYETAMVSLAQSIYTDIRSRTEMSAWEDDGGAGSSYLRDIGLNSDMRIDGAKKYVTFSGGKYVVYCYFNKKKYVDERMTEYGKWMTLADKYLQDYKNDAYPRALNYLYGSLYHAYESMDDRLMGVLHPYSKSLKDDVFGRLSEMHRNYFPRPHVLKGSGVLFPVVLDCERYIPDFEYLNADGEWNTPDGYRKYPPVSHPYHEDKLTPLIFCSGGSAYHGPEFRILYEDEVGGRPVRLYVPEKFHFEKYNL